MQVLSQAMIGNAINEVVVEPAEIVKFYEGHHKKYAQVAVRTIYLAFSEDPAADGASRQPRTQAEALATAQTLLAAIRAGADFVRLVKENSDDATSRAKDGDFGTLRFTDNIPDALRTAVFALKKGEVSEPVRQPHGYYLLRAEDVGCRPLSEVRDEIYNELKNAHAKEWLDRDSGLLSPELGAGIRRVKGVRRLGVRVGNWLTSAQAKLLLERSDIVSVRGKRNHAILAMLIGCGLRGGELLWRWTEFRFGKSIG